jgi:hypothetical protein
MNEVKHQTEVGGQHNRAGRWYVRCRCGWTSYEWDSPGKAETAGDEHVLAMIEGE